MIKHCVRILFIGLIYAGNLYAQAPVITSFSPAGGAPGTVITINGNNLANSSAITIGGKALLLISAAHTQLAAMVMPGTVSGTIGVKTANGTAQSAGNFTIIPSTYPNSQLGTKVVDSSIVYYAQQGNSVAISADGKTAIVGNPGDNGYLGSSTIYILSGGAWVKQGPELHGSGETDYYDFRSDAILYAEQGKAVAISADGNTVVEGGPYDNNYNGAFWVFTRSNGVWSQQGGKLIFAGITYSRFGSVLAISGDGNTVIAGGEYNTYEGSFGVPFIFTRSNGVWSQQTARIPGTDTLGVQTVASSVAISADGNTAAVGAAADGFSQGDVYVFTRNGKKWVQQGAKLKGDGYYASQGSSVALDADGNTLLEGGSYNNDGVGAAFVFTRKNEQWTQQGNGLTGTGSTGDAMQGNSVAISADGNTALVGGNFDNSDAGAAWLFTCTDSVWAQQGKKITVAESTAADFGYSVSLSGDGGMAFIGGPADHNSLGAAWVFNAQPTTITLPATAITKTEAVLNGLISDNQNNTNVTMQYDTTTAFTHPKTVSISSGVNPIPAGSGVNSVSSAVNNLTPGTTYYFRVSGAYNGGVSNGDILSFTTIGQSPVPSFIYGTADFNPKPQYKGVSYSSSNTAVATIVNGKVHIAGVGTVTISGTLGGVSGNEAIRVTPAPLTITADSKSGISGYPLPPLTASYSGFVNGDTPASLTTAPTLSTTATRSSPANNYPITVSGAADTDYTITYVAGTLAFAPSSYYSSAIPIKTYGDADFYEFGQYAQGVSYTSSNTDVATIVNGMIHITGAGTATITANDGNNSLNKILTVKPAPLIVTANDETKAAGAANPKLTVHYAGFVYSETPAVALTAKPVISTTATASSPVGTYPINVSGAAAPNYTFTYVAGTLTITAGGENYPLVNKTTNTDATLAPRVNTAISPNGDGVNDVLTIANIEKYPDNKLLIMDGNGAKVFEISGYDNLDKAFKGRSNISGRMMRAGTYFYRLQYHDNGVLKSRTGYVVLKYN